MEKLIQSIWFENLDSLGYQGSIAGRPVSFYF